MFICKQQLCLTLNGSSFKASLCLYFSLAESLEGSVFATSNSWMTFRFLAVTQNNDKRGIRHGAAP